MTTPALTSDEVRRALRGRTRPGRTPAWIGVPHAVDSDRVVRLEIWHKRQGFLRDLPDDHVGVLCEYTDDGPRTTYVYLPAGEQYATLIAVGGGRLREFGSDRIVRLADLADRPCVEVQLNGLTRTATAVTLTTAPDDIAVELHGLSSDTRTRMPMGSPVPIPALFAR